MCVFVFFLGMGSTTFKKKLSADTCENMSFVSIDALFVCFFHEMMENMTETYLLSKKGWLLSNHVRIP